MGKKRYFVYGLCFILILGVCSALAADRRPTYSSEMNMAREAIVKALVEIGLPKGDGNLLVLTNAGHGQIGPQTTEAFLDIAREATGCSLGTRSLLAVHTSVNEPFWCSLYRKDTGKIVFFRWTGRSFDQQILSAVPGDILNRENWKQAVSGMIGSRLFSIVSISLAWSANPPWPLLLAATFHDHFCPGLNSGYIAGEYLKRRLPLEPGDQYIFVTAPAKCAADALQVMYNTTAGKESGYGMFISQGTLNKYSQKDVAPTLIAMRVNKKADICEGVVLGFDWMKAYADTNVKAEEREPKEGPADPMFWISRVIMSWKMANMPLEKQFGYIAEQKRFSGKASIAAEIASGDPYALVWNR